MVNNAEDNGGADARLTTTFDQWAYAHNIPEPLIRDYYSRLSGPSAAPLPDEYGESESAVQSRVRVEAAHLGIRLWRNNVGATETDTGSFVRYGLANDSKKLNRVIKSGDLIGIAPRLITPDMVGQVLGQFVSREVKPVGWAYSGSDRERAQLRWAELITGAGGDAQFVTAPGSFAHLTSKS